VLKMEEIQSGKKFLDAPFTLAKVLMLSCSVKRCSVEGKNIRVLGFEMTLRILGWRVIHKKMLYKDACEHSTPHECILNLNFNLINLT